MTRAPARLAAALLALVSTISPRASAPADAPDPRALLEQAIAFHGGRQALGSLPHYKATGTIDPGGRLAGRALDFVVYERADGGRRTETTFELRGRKVTSVEIYDGRICKRRFGTAWDDLPLDENRERAAHRIGMLVEAVERSPVLAGEGTEGGAAVWRVAVPDGRGQAVLSIAEDDARLVAIEYPGTEAEGMGTKTEVTRKIVHRAFQRAGGVQVPSDIEVLKDGSFDGRMRFETIETLEDWDDDWLRIPDPRRRFIPPEELAN